MREATLAELRLARPSALRNGQDWSAYEAKLRIILDNI